MAGDRTDEIMAVMETLADWMDTVDWSEDNDYYFPGLGKVSDEELVTAVWQILELTQLLLSEHGALQRQMHEFIGTLQMVKNVEQQQAQPVVDEAKRLRLIQDPE